MVLVQSLFAQLCAPLDHVGQHFRDCVSAAEDLRDLETLKRVLLITKKDDKNIRIGEKKNKNHDIQIIENDQMKKKLIVRNRVVNVTDQSQTPTIEYDGRLWRCCFC